MKTENIALEHHKSIGKAISFIRFCCISFENVGVSPFKDFFCTTRRFLNKNVLNRLCLLVVFVFEW